MPQPPPIKPGWLCDVPTGVYPRILVIAYSSAPGAPEAYLDAKEVNKQAIGGSSSYTFDWTAGKFI
jgi:hypothetical protein